MRMSLTSLQAIGVAAVLSSSALARVGKSVVPTTGKKADIYATTVAVTTR